MQVKGTTASGVEKKSTSSAEKKPIAQSAANKYNADGQKKTVDTRAKMEAVRSNNQSSAIGKPPSYKEYVASTTPIRTPDSTGMGTNFKNPVGFFATKNEVQTGKQLNEVNTFNDVVSYLTSGQTDYNTTQNYLAQVNQQAAIAQPSMAKNSLAFGWRSLRTALMQQAGIDNANRRDAQSKIVADLAEQRKLAQNAYNTARFGEITYEDGLPVVTGKATKSELDRLQANLDVVVAKEKEAQDLLDSYIATNPERDELINTMHTNAGLLKGGLTEEQQGRLLDIDAQLGNVGVGYGWDFVRKGALVKGILEKGAGHVNKGVTGFFNWAFGDLFDEFTALANTALGDVGIKKELPNVVSSLDKWVNDVVAADEEYFGENVEGSSIAKTIDKYGTMTAEAIPMAVIAHLTAGSSLTTEGLMALSGLEQASGLSRIAQITSNTLKARATDPNFQFTFVQTFGQSYEEALADGASVEEASVFALLNAYTNTSIEIEGGIQGLPENLKNGDKKALLAYAKSIVEEVGEEWRQNPAEKALKGIYQPVELYSTENEDAVINPQRAFEEAKGAAVVSALLGGAPTMAQARAEAKAPKGSGIVDSQGRAISSQKDREQGYIERHQQSTAFEEQRKLAERTAEFLKKQQEQREAMKGSEENLDTGATIEGKKPEAPKGEQKANAKVPKKPQKKAPKVKDRHTFTSDNGAVVNARIEQTSDGKWHYRDDMKNEYHPDGTDLVYGSYKEAKAHLEDLKISVKEIEEQAELAEQEAARKTTGENKAEQKVPEGLKEQEAPTASETTPETQAESAPTQTQPETKELVKPGEERAEKKAPKNPDKAAAWKKAEAERTARNNALRADIKKRVSQVADEDVTVSGTYNGSSVTAVYDGETIQLTNAQGQPLTPITPKNRKDARQILYDIAKETRGTVDTAPTVNVEQPTIEKAVPAKPVEVETEETSVPAEEAITEPEAPAQEIEAETKAEPTTEETETIEEPSEKETPEGKLLEAGERPVLNPEDEFGKTFYDTLESKSFDEFYDLYKNNPDEFNRVYQLENSTSVDAGYAENDVRDFYNQKHIEEEKAAVTTESVADGVKAGTITPEDLRTALKNPDIDVAAIRKALGMRAVNTADSLRTSNTIGNMVRRYNANLAKMKSADALTEAEKKAIEGEAKQKQKNDIQNAKEKAIRNQSVEEQLKGEELSDSLRENDESANQSGREDGNDAEPVSDISGGDVGGGLDVRSTKPGGKRKTGNAGSGVLVEPTDSRKYGSVEREIAEAYKEKNLTLDQKQQIEGSRDAWNEEYKKANVPIMASKNVSKTYKKLLAVANKYGRKFLTIRDAANARISRAESGRCLTLTSIIGPTLITHRYFPQSARRHILNLDGQSAIHEYSHDFGTVYAEEHDGNRPDYSEGLKAVTQSLVDSGLILDKDQAKIRNQLIHLYFNKVGVNSTIGTLFARKYKGSPEWKKAENAAKLQQEKSEYAKKTGKEKAEYLKTNYSTDYKEMLKTVREEIMMELVSEGSYFREVLKAKGQDISNYSKPARAWMEKDGGVPAGFYDEIIPIAAQLDKENLAWLEEQDKIRNDDGTFIESASTNLDTVNEEIDLSSNQESIEDFFDYPEGATDIRQNKGIAELRSQGERIHADNVEYQSVSHQAIIDAANKTINRILNSGKYSAQDIANWFSNRSPRNADRFIMQLGKEMFYRLQQQRVSLETSGGKAVSDARLTIDVNQLSKLEESFGAWVTNAVGNAGEILGQHADLSPVVATKNNAKNSFIGNIKPGEIDPNSEGAKMYRIVDDHVSYQESINAKKEAGKITEAEGAQLYAKEIMELSKIRDVRGTFGNAGKMMDAWERNMINFILKHDKHAYDTLRMLALGSTNRISSDFNNVGTVDTIKQVRYLFLLSNFATKVNNVLNNLESSTTGAIGQNIAVALTGKRAEKLMGEQTMTYNSNWGRLFPRGVNKELNEYMLTKGAESVLSLYYGLEVDEGIIDMDTGGRYNQNSSTAGRILARAQFLSGLGMQTTDAMAIARAYKGQEINIDKMDISEARKQVLKKQAMENARAQMYHAESKAAKLMNNARDALNSVKTFGNDVTGKIGLGDILMPFVQVPTNVAMRAIRATPAGVFYSFGKYFRGMRALEARKAQVQTADKYRLMQENGVALSVDQQNYLRKYGNLKMPTDAEVVALQRAFGEGASNAAITLVAAVLAGMGGIRDFDDEDDKDLQRLAKERGFTGLQINLSHPFKKDNQDWDYDNDVIIGGSWLEVAALPVCAGYALYHAAIEDGGDFASVLQTVMTSPMRSINTIVDTAKEIPGMQQIGKIWDAYENLQYEKDLSKKGDKIVAGLTQYAANTLSTFVIPNQVAQFAAGIDNTVRDVYSADTNWEVARNIFQSKIPFWRNKLPEKKSSFGETRTYGPDIIRSIANRMIIPGTGIQIWKKSELERYYEKMSKSGHTNIMVENSAPKSIKTEGQVFDLDAKERRDFDSMRDVETRKAQEALLHSDGFLSLPEDLQEVAMRDARSLVNHLTEQYTLDNKKDCTANVDLDKWEDAYKNKYEEAAQFLTAKYGAKEFFKNNELLDAKAADAYLKDTYSKLDDTARELLDNSYAHLDSMYDAYSGTGMTAEQYWRVEQLRKKYAAQQKAEDNEESASALQRNLIVEYENMKDLTPEQKAWAEENKKLWINIPASTETIDKIRKVTGLTAKEADDWLDLKANTAPLGGYKKLSQNQRLMMVRDSNYSEEKKWALIEYEASDSAWAKLVKFRDEGKTVAEALEQARWYKPTKFTRWVEQRYDVIYDQEPNEEEEED